MGIKERKEREKNMRQQQIMDVAKKVFSAKGFRGATMEEIAQEAELSPGTLYSYFNNKDDLYASLNFKILERLFRKTEELHNDIQLTTEEKIDALMRLYYDVYVLEPLILKSVLSLQSSKDFLNLSDELFSKINRLASKGLRATAKIFEDGIREGIIIDYHPMALTDIIWAIFSGLVVWEESKRMADPRKNYLKKTIDIAIEIIGRGIKRTSQ